MFRSLFTALLIMALPVTAFADADIGKPAPDFTAADYLGKQVKLSDYKGKIVVLEWTNPGCPFVHKHYDSGNMQKLQAYAKSKGVVWLTVNSNSEGREGYLSAQDAKIHFAKEKPLGAHYLLDADGTLGKLYGAKSTPHMFVIDKTGTLVYMGAIDDKPTPDPASLEGAHNYVKAAIDSLLAGQPIETASTRAYGCSIKYAD